jgi:hypothetical protein
MLKYENQLTFKNLNGCFVPTLELLTVY